ncbi:hypothetical protein DFA_06439 [Cavenderia fasciculata]|uniref:C-CAP/cofactor C-like domain-containing protein n=1 Tax=Cavenderia fasciculata TaxID=261658 RepID=F4PJ03_CACFS|nr:uncharacterized protein DFA_06439 [Cavenderia fasciculata]EGG24289.1 hypothetical protein DFA_06439 [Cavenderia fasciculata]|eukprot:XP_004362140.1 hypothetical protein DFA_06439 [Cavenderia fasciculata]
MYIMFNNNNNNNTNTSSNSQLNEIAQRLEQRDEEREELKRKKKQENDRNQIDQNTTKSLTDTSNDINTIIQLSNENTQIQQQQLNGINESISTLKKLFNESIILLTQYDVRLIQDSINKIDSKCLQVKNKITPKSKFSFAKKTTTCSISPSPTPIVQKQQQQQQPTKPNDTNETIISNSRILNIKSQTLNFQCNQSSGDNNNELSIAKITDSTLIINKKLDNHEDSGKQEEEITSLQIDQIKNSKIIIYGIVDGSVFIDHANDSIFVISSRQIRIHNCHNCQFYIHTKSNPIIETCKSVSFAPYPFTNNNNNNNDTTANNDNWKHVNDFDWLQTNIPSPNWNIIDQNNRINFE